MAGCSYYIKSPKKSATATISAVQIDDNFSFLCHNGDIAPNAYFKIIQYRKRGLLCDVELQVSEGASIKAHKMVLMASIEYFENLFQDSNDIKYSVINCEHIHADSLRILIEYTYTGQVWIRKDNVEALLETAKFLGMEDVFRECCDFLRRNMNTSDCFNIANLADTLNYPSLRESAHEFICKNFVKLSHTFDFLSLRSEELAAILSSDKLVFPNKEFVYERVKTWSMHNRSERESQIQGMMELVQSPLVMSVEMEEASQDITEETCQPPKSYKMLSGTMETLNISDDPEEPAAAYDQGKLIAFGGRDFTETTVESIEIYDERENHWSEHMRAVGDFHYKRSCSCIRIANPNEVESNKLLVLGGVNLNGKASKSAEIVNLNNKTVTTVPSMNHFRYSFGTAILEGKNGTFVYAVGGEKSPEKSFFNNTDGRFFLREVERWDFKSNMWCNVSSLRIARANFAMAEWKGNLYVAGGLICPLNAFARGCSATDVVEVFSGETETWKLGLTLTCPRSQACMVADSQHLYILGGFNSRDSFISTVEELDLERRCWIHVTFLPKDMWEVSACFYRGKLIVCGGTMEADEVFQYDRTKDEWIQLASFARVRRGAGIHYMPSFKNT